MSDVSISNISPRARHRARIIAMQVIYQWEVSKNPLSEILAESRIANQHFKMDWSFCEELILGVGVERDDLDTQITPYLIDPLSKTNPVELAILRLGVYELTARLEIPYQIIVSEYVNVAAEYGAEQGERFVNGVLDKIAKQIRKI